MQKEKALTQQYYNYKWQLKVMFFSTCSSMQSYLYTSIALSSLNVCLPVTISACEVDILDSEMPIIPSSSQDSGEFPRSDELTGPRLEALLSWDGQGNTSGFDLSGDELAEDDRVTEMD